LRIPPYQGGTHSPLEEIVYAPTDETEVLKDGTRARVYRLNQIALHGGGQHE
jgi:hypothetical protein